MKKYSIAGLLCVLVAVAVMAAVIEVPLAPAFTPAVQAVVGGGGGGVAGGGALSFVQTTGTRDTNAGTTVAVAFDSAVTSGNLIAVMLGYFSTTVTVESIADTHGNTYTFIDENINGDGRGHTIRTYYAKNITGGSNTITVTFSGTVSVKEIIAQEISGAHLTYPLDTHNITLSDYFASAATDALTTSAIITSVNNAYIFAAHLNNGEDETTINVGTGFTKQVIGEDLDKLYTEYKTLVTAGSVSGKWTKASAVGGRHYLCIIAFKPQ
jgi:hypothetical protein